MAAQQDQIARFLKRLGFQLIKAGKAFKVSDSAGGMAAGSKPTMTLAEIERWIGDHIKPKR
jgi:hypothetical protein